MGVQSDASGSSESSTTPAIPSSPSSCSDCLPLVTSLNRQSAAMERLADLLPQLIAVNQVLIEMIAERDEPEPSETYLDGSPVSANGTART